jgi:predicted transcriptional regulator
MDPIQNGHGVTATIDPPVVSAAPSGSEAIARDEDAIEMDILEFLEAQGTAKLTEIEAALDLNRFQVVNALKLLVEQGMVEKDVRNHKPMVYRLRTEQSEQG